MHQTNEAVRQIVKISSSKILHCACLLSRGLVINKSKIVIESHGNHKKITQEDCSISFSNKLILLNLRNGLAQR